MIKKSRLLINKGGRGFISYRATLPKGWVEQMGFTDGNKNIIMTFKDNKIIIEKRGASGGKTDSNSKR